MTNDNANHGLDQSLRESIENAREAETDAVDVILEDETRRRAIAHWADIARDAIADLEAEARCHGARAGADYGAVRHALAMIEDAASRDQGVNGLAVELYWTSEDGTGEFPMGLYQSEEAATAAIPAATAELLAECGADQERANIRAGRWSTTVEER